MAKRTADLEVEKKKMDVANSFVKAKHPDRMDLNAMKFFRLVIAQCKQGDGEFFEYEFKISDLANLFHIQSQNLYSEAQNMCIRLQQSVLVFGDDVKKDWKVRNIFEGCDYEAQTGIIKVQLSKDMTELCLQLKRNFTEVPIAAVLTMRSKYAVRLYELICQKMMHHYPHADTCIEIQISLEEARSVTGTENKKTYDHIGHFKSKVLKNALEDIEENSEWKIICTDIKRGRSITGFNLVIWSKVGYSVVEERKRKGEISYKSDEVPGQLSLFDL